MEEEDRVEATEEEGATASHGTAQVDEGERLLSVGVISSRGAGKSWLISALGRVSPSVSGVGCGVMARSGPVRCVFEEMTAAAWLGSSRRPGGVARWRCAVVVYDPKDATSVREGREAFGAAGAVTGVSVLMCCNFADAHVRLDRDLCESPGGRRIVQIFRGMDYGVSVVAAFLREAADAPFRGPPAAPRRSGDGGDGASSTAPTSTATLVSAMTVSAGAQRGDSLVLQLEFFSDQLCQRHLPPFETLKRDDHLGPNEMSFGN